MRTLEKVRFVGVKELTKEKTTDQRDDSTDEKNMCEFKLINNEGLPTEGSNVKSPH